MSRPVEQACGDQTEDLFVSTKRMNKCMHLLHCKIISREAHSRSSRCATPVHHWKVSSVPSPCKWLGYSELLSFHVVGLKAKLWRDLEQWEVKTMRSPFFSAICNASVAFFSTWPWLRANERDWLRLVDLSNANDNGFLVVLKCWLNKHLLVFAAVSPLVFRLNIWSVNAVRSGLARKRDWLKHMAYPCLQYQYYISIAYFGVNTSHDGHISPNMNLIKFPPGSCSLCTLLGLGFCQFPPFLQAVIIFLAVTLNEAKKSGCKSWTKNPLKLETWRAWFKIYVYIYILSNMQRLPK